MQVSQFARLNITIYTDLCYEFSRAESGYRSRYFAMTSIFHSFFQNYVNVSYLIPSQQDVLVALASCVGFRTALRVVLRMVS